MTRTRVLIPGPDRPISVESYCPYKGSVSYYSITVGDEVAPAG